MARTRVCKWIPLTFLESNLLTIIPNRRSCEVSQCLGEADVSRAN